MLKSIDGHKSCFKKLSSQESKVNVPIDVACQGLSLKLINKKGLLTYNNEVIMMLGSVDNPGPLFWIISRCSEKLEQL